MGYAYLISDLPNKEGRPFSVGEIARRFNLSIPSARRYLGLAEGIVNIGQSIYTPSRLGLDRVHKGHS